MNLKLIEHYQQKDPCLKAKYDMGAHHKGYFCGGSNIIIKLITCDDNIVIISKLQSYVLHWYHTYLFHPGMDITAAMVLRRLYWTDKREAPGGK